GMFLDIPRDEASLIIHGAGYQIAVLVDGRGIIPPSAGDANRYVVGKTRDDNAAGGCPGQHAADLVLRPPGSPIVGELLDLPFIFFHEGKLTLDNGKLLTSGLPPP